MRQQLISALTIGILALQGGFAAHQKKIATLGANTVLIKRPTQLENLDALIIPGGESTTLLKHFTALHFYDAICAFAKQGKTIFGTCAGMILLAKTVDPQQNSLQLIDITVKRNAYGRQLDSHIRYAPCHLHEETIDTELVFIRAPLVTHYAKTVTPLIIANNEAVLLRQDNILVASFHPELSEQQHIHQFFLEVVLNQTYPI
jgi:pyridoxal 5'-phosphate synthase pdxT subunit